MATDKTYPSGLRRVGSGTPETFHALYGNPTPDSIEAAFNAAKGTADGAYDTLEKLAATSTTVDAGTPASVTVSGPMGAKVLNFTIPRGADGAPGMGYSQGLTLISQNQSTLAAAQSAQADAAQSAEEATLAMQAQFLTQDEGVAALIGTSAGPETQAALGAWAAATLPSGGGGGGATISTDDFTGVI